jgi:arabinofuranan 3-O-arabinosyltransferase
VSAVAVRRGPRRRYGTGGQRWRRSPLVLAVGAFGLAFAQRPGQDTADTKIGLHVNPGHFLSDLASVWSRTEGLGHVQGGQYSGYLWPMDPFFALGHLVGLPDWVTERLWIGMLLALAAWGVIRLVDELLEPDRGVAHLVAGAVYMVNPYVVVFTSRDTVFLLAYAALPWLMLIAHRGLREPRRWWWPAAFALVTTSSGGGVNATVTALVLLGPVLLVAYEVLLGDARRGVAWSLTWRTGLATGLACVWWVIPLLVQAAYGLNFLQFTEQVGAIWATTSLPESLRLMGYWPSYLGVGYASRLLPYYQDSATLLFNPLTVAASLLVPALALAGYLWTRRWRYAPFLLALSLTSLLVMSVGYPTGTLARSGVTFIYNHVTALQFLRTTYKAGPLLALAVALLAGAGMRAAWQRWHGWSGAAALGVGGVLLVLGSLPLFEGRALELTWKSVPAAWTQAGRELDRGLPANSRAAVLPGQSYAFYTWGGTVDPILMATTRKPIAIRNVPPFDDLHAADFLWTVDGLVQQSRLLLGELSPLLNLMSARQVVTGSDDNPAYSGATPAEAAARELSSQAGLARPAHSYGPVRSFASPAATADPAARLPQVRIYDTPARGLVRLEPRGPATVVDGSAQGIADVAALGELPTAPALFYAGDESAAEIRRQAQAGGSVFITDSNRRQVFVTSRVRQNLGPTIPADQAFTPDAAVLSPFAARDTNAQTVTQFTGVRYLKAPYNPEIAQFPAHSPYAAFDGNPLTSWQGDPTLDPNQDWIEVGFDAPRNVASIELLPDQSDPLSQLTQVQIGGRRFAIHPGWNRLALNLRAVSALRIALTKGRSVGASAASAGGLAEVRIPGVHVGELMRPPVLAERALRGADLRRASLNYVLERTTADQPLQRGPAPAKAVVRGSRLQAEAALIAGAQDPETGITRTIDPPAARTWAIGGLASASPNAPDPELDRIAGTSTAGSALRSSGRLQGLPRFRASSAFDGSAATAWVAPIGPYQPAWISWSTPRAQALNRFTLVRSGLPVRFPTRVSVTPLGGGAPLSVNVGPGGVVRLPRPLRAAGFRVDIVRAAGSPRAAVGIAEIRAPGIPRAAVRTGGTIAGRCGQMSAVVAGRQVALRLSGSLAAFSAGEPLRVSACGGPITLPAARIEVNVAGGVVRPLLIELRSPAPTPSARAAVVTGRVVDAGDQGNGSYTGVHVAVSGPSWLVLGESYNRGWQASCNGRSLGAPRVIDAFANGWPVGPGCRNVSITFAPQNEVDAGYVIGGAACLLLLVLLVLRRPGPAPGRAAEELSLRDRFPRLPAFQALGVGVACAAVFGFVFALRAGAVIGPAVALILWRGLTIRRALQGAGVLLVVVVPLVYLIFPGHDQGGYDLGYVSQHLGAHWVAVAAFSLLLLVLLLDLDATQRLKRRIGRSTR